MTRIERAIEIDREPEVVFAVLADLDRVPIWATTVSENHDVPGRPLQTGDTFRQTLRVGGLPLSSEWTVRAVERPKRLEYEAAAPGGGWLVMIQRVSASGGGSRVELEIEYELPAGFLGEVLDRVYVERRNEREAEHSLQNLKDLVEGGAGG